MRQECLNTIYSLAKKNNKIIFIGSDLGPGVLSDFKKKIPKRFFMEGVSEQFIIGMSAGLAIDGYKPYVNTIATFITRRCFEQICIDLCLHNLSVKLIGNGGGLVYAPLGPTHQATEDISILRTLPNMKIIAPCDAIEMKKLMLQIDNVKGPIYIRVARGGEKIITREEDKIEFGKAIIKKKPGDYIFLTTGIMPQLALAACKILQKNKKDAGVIHFSTIKPLDGNILKKWLPRVKKVITVEESFLTGGFGSSILEYISDNLPKHLHKIKRIGLKDCFVERYGTQDDLFKHYNLYPEYLAKKILEK